MFGRLRKVEIRLAQLEDDKRCKEEAEFESDCVDMLVKLAKWCGNEAKLRDELDSFFRFRKIVRR